MPNPSQKDKIEQAIGRFIIEFARLENHMRLAILATIGVEHEAGFFLVRKMDANVLCTKLRTALRQLALLDDNAKACLDVIQSVTEKRNDILHNAPSLKGDDPCLFVYPFGQSLQKGNTDAQARYYTLAYITLLAKASWLAGRDIGALVFSKAIPEKFVVVGLTKAEFPNGLPSNPQKPDLTVDHTPDLELRALAEAKFSRLEAHLRGAPQ